MNISRLLLLHSLQNEFLAQLIQIKHNFFIFDSLVFSAKLLSL